MLTRETFHILLKKSRDKLHLPVDFCHRSTVVVNLWNHCWPAREECFSWKIPEWAWSGDWRNLCLPNPAQMEFLRKYISLFLVLVMSWHNSRARNLDASRVKSGHNTTLFGSCYKFLVWLITQWGTTESTRSNWSSHRWCPSQSYRDMYSDKKQAMLNLN